MAIKNKDGTNYKCTRPNTLVKTQEWIKDYVLHNCNWDNTETKENLPIKQLIEIQKTPLLEEMEVEIPDPIQIVDPIETEEIQIVDPIETEEIQIVYRSLEKPIQHKDAIVFHCLPIKNGKYEDPFDFEGLMYSEEDLVLVFWTNIQLDAGSIVYPYKHSVNRLQYPGYRWWKVTECKQHRVGYFVYTFISEECPDFT